MSYKKTGAGMTYDSLDAFSLKLANDFVSDLLHWSLE